ncbi:uncharacterized protein LOC111902976 [Lactuca sativa]|uniref:uncharacterized protein LOC111902976 n=1 Tax=Lactuca sativa TaxID=4236 RepID=UPI000CD91158|nr:uncharacterized protein LOC111902976 [Lactuca sativa]
MAFVTCGCTGKIQNAYVVRQFKVASIRWWNTLGKTLIPNKTLQLRWEECLTHFKRTFSSAEDMLDLENQLLTLKKGSMIVDEYTDAFTDKLEFALRVVPDELAKIDRYSKGLPWEYYVLLKQASTFELAIWVANSVENMITKRTTDRAEVDGKRKVDGSSGIKKKNNNKKKKMFLKSSSKPGSNQEGKWCDQCKKKHFEDCVVCFKCKKPRNISTNCLVKGKVCFSCGEEGHMNAECQKAVKQTSRILPSKPKGRSYQMTLNEAKEETNIASGTFLFNQIPVKILFDSRADHSFISHEFGRKLRLSPLKAKYP